MNGRQGWRAVGIEQRIGFDVPGGVEVREDLDLVYVYAEPLGDKPSAVLSRAAATPAVLRAAVRRAAQEIADAIFAPEAGR